MPPQTDKHDKAAPVRLSRRVQMDEASRVRLQTISEGLSRVREIATRKRKRRRSMVDEFIAERRAQSLA